MDEVAREVDVGLLQGRDLPASQPGLSSQEDEEVGARVELLRDGHEPLEDLGFVELDLGGNGLELPEGDRH